MKRKNNPKKSRKKHGKNHPERETRQRWFRSLKRIVRENSAKNTEDETERVVILR